jgi:hypothetical protein
MREATPLVAERITASVKEDMQWPERLVSAVQHAAHQARENPLELATVSAFALGKRLSDQESIEGPSTSRAAPTSGLAPPASVDRWW